MKKLAFVLLAAAAAVSAPAFAQDTTATLRVDNGSAMASDGGQFETANTGRALDAGDKVMVNPDSKVTLVYGNDCTMVLDAPGVYTVPGACSRAAWARTGSPGKSALVIVGAGLIGAAVLESMDKTPPGPLSASVRHF